MQRYALATTDDFATFVTLQEAAARLRVSPDTIRRRIKTGVLPAVLVAGRYRIRPADLNGMVSAA